MWSNYCYTVFMLKIITNTIINRITAITMVNEGVANRIPPKNTPDQLNKMNRKKFQKILIETGVYLKQYPNKIPYLVTITTKQNSTFLNERVMSHKEAKQRLSMWLELRVKQKVFTAYLWWCEIQHKTTNDIHFHIVVFSDIEKPFDIKKEVLYLNEKFPQTGTNVINIAKIKNNADGVLYYMLSYMKKFKTSYIHGKVCQLSQEIRKCYKQHAGIYITTEFHSDNIMQFITNKKIYSNEFVTSYYLNIFDEPNGKVAPNRIDVRVNKMAALPIETGFYEIVD